MDIEVVARLQAYVETLNMQTLQEVQNDVECLGLLPDEEDTDPYAELYEEWL